MKSLGQLAALDDGFPKGQCALNPAKIRRRNLAGRKFSLKSVPRNLNATFRTHPKSQQAVVYLSDFLSSVAHCATLRLGNSGLAGEESAREEITQFLVSGTAFSSKILKNNMNDCLKARDSFENT